MDESNAKTPVASPGIANDTGANSIPVIEFLSGRFRGTHERITEKTVFLIINEFGGVSIVPASRADKDVDYPISLHRSGNTYDLEVSPAINVWVNGKKVSQHTLLSG